ncbi:MAG: carbamoyltransferase HypF [Firmicutes bacterium]|nr:carbamoyltransferase HypF [Bacillota bacterium]
MITDGVVDRLLAYEASKHDIEARQIHLDGVVQGVGFRPTVFRLAAEHGLAGWVLNSASGLDVWVEGPASAVESFCRELIGHPPKLARITRQEILPREPEGFESFTIRHSESQGAAEVLISPDVATCDECLGEVTDPADRRFGYPFTNCTNCGPRYTIVMDLPYDRASTTMKKFPMCPTCQREYDDPAFRRFHAQPNACPVCGPRLKLLDSQREEIAGEPLAETRRMLGRGKIMAVKGLGGFHLACNAKDPEAVRLLRQRKRREYKPFAVMARDLETIKRFCRVSEAEREMLEGVAAPIVILDRVNDEDLPVAYLAPGISTLGVMLPYTPLHHLLFQDGLELLVMTSANISDDPLVTENDEAIEKLAEIADAFLLHDRDIFSRCDDSVLRVIDDRPMFSRRARGYVPLPVDLPLEGPTVLACGGEIKNTFALTRGREAYPSQHVGDLEHYRNYQQFLFGVPHLEGILKVNPQVVAYDLHPEYAASRYGRSRTELFQVPVQHHHAHLASCMAEHRLTGDALGVICDGTGYGTDGGIWGFEFLLGGYGGYERLGHLAYVPLVGGETSIRRPERMAYAFLLSSLGAEAGALAERFLPGLSEEELRMIPLQIERRLNTWPTSSCGRLFDGVSGLLGVCREVGYEGQAAIELETLAEKALGRKMLPSREMWELAGKVYRMEAEGGLLAWGPLWRELVDDLLAGTPSEMMALRFHLAVAEGIIRMVSKIRAETGVSRVVLSGGSWQNRILLRASRYRLEQEGFEVYSQHLVPPNDGGIALGQAAVALARYREQSAVND